MPSRPLGPLESKLEKDCIEFANANRCLFKKLQGVGWNGFPDRTLLVPGGGIYFFELKRKGKKPRPDQLNVHRELKRYGQSVFVVDDIEDFKKIVIGILK